LELAPSVAMLTYQSAYISSYGCLERHANRSSIWRHEALGWAGRWCFTRKRPLSHFQTMRFDKLLRSVRTATAFSSSARGAEGIFPAICLNSDTAAAMPVTPTK
jgi:hypothetical protein